MPEAACAPCAGAHRLCHAEPDDRAGPGAADREQIDVVARLHLGLSHKAAARARTLDF
jgi:hypothetical protein